MPFRNKMSSSKQPKTYAVAAAGPKKAAQKADTSIFSFQNTECKLGFEIAISNRQVPNTDLKNSVFFDLRNLPVSEQELFEFLTPQINGIAFREDLGLLEAAFPNEQTADEFLKKPCIINEKAVVPLPPRHKSPRILRIKMANVPLLPLEQVQTALVDHWAQYAAIRALAPYTYKGTNITTRRWDMVLELIPEATKLEAPVAFSLLGSNILASWKGAPPSCLSCKTAGHYSTKCPRRFPKNTTEEQMPNPQKHQPTNAI